MFAFFRDNGLRTYIVTRGGRDFVWVYSEATSGIPPEQVVGAASATTSTNNTDGEPILAKEPKLLLNDDNACKSKRINLTIGRRPVASFGDSTGELQMLEIHDGRRRAATGGAAARRRGA